LVLATKLTWILKEPYIFKEWGNFGISLSDEQWYYTLKYFQLWNEQELNITEPKEMKIILYYIQYIKNTTNINMALSFF